MEVNATYFCSTTSNLIWRPGFLVAACVNRAPEGLLGAAVAEVGVLDLLKVRYRHTRHDILLT